MPSWGAPSPAPQCLFGATWGWGERFCRENLSASPPPLGGSGTHVGWAWRGWPAGPRGGGEGMSTWLPLQAARRLVSALEPHCRELGVSQPVPPSPIWVGGPWVGRKVDSTLPRALEFFSSCFDPRRLSTVGGEGLSRCAGRLFPADGGVCWGG